MTPNDNHRSRRRSSAIADLGSLTGEDDERRRGRWSAAVDQPRIERAVREILAAVGEDPDREGLLETPARVARMYAELFAACTKIRGIHLQKFFTEKYDEVVLVRDISFNSMCEHHMLPFMGVAHVGYVPNGRVIGLSKLARVVEVVARRPQVQERMTETIANLLVEELRRQGRGRGDRGHAHLHDDPRHSQAGQPVRHLGHEGHLPLESFQPLGSDEPDLRRPALAAASHRVTVSISPTRSAACRVRFSPNSSCGCRSAWRWAWR